MKKSKKKSKSSDIESYNQELRERYRKAFESSGMKVIPMEELPDEFSDRYEVTFWRKKKE